MRTRLIFHEGTNRLEITVADGRMARGFLRRWAMPSLRERKETIREIHVSGVEHETVLEEFNRGDDTTAMALRDDADVKIVNVPDPGSVSGSFFGDSDS
jgi:hypothetical protein